MRILIAERQALLRAGISQLIKAGAPGWDVIEAADLEAARSCLRGGGAAVVLIGIELLELPEMPDLRRLRQDFPATRLMVRVGHPRTETILSAVRAGAHGCITSSTSEVDLLIAIQTVAAGEVSLPADFMPATPGATHGTMHGTMMGDRPAARLTGRQTEVLSLLEEGRSTKEIARTLDLAVGTIKVHLASIYRALGARNRVEAATRAAKFNRSPEIWKHVQ